MPAASAYASSSPALAPSLELGAVRLRVRDLDRLVDWYVHRLELTVHHATGDRAVLGTAGRALLDLAADPAARRTEGTTGLYHFALLVPDRTALAAALARLAGSATRLAGASDHGVSEALYLADPEGNGIEIYRDRRPAEWPRDPAGRLAMVTRPLDVEALLEDAPPRAIEEPVGLAAGTRMGHVHLHVGDLAAAERFYVDGLGLEVRQRYGPSALFLAADGYHHHVGLNTWQGEGAPAPPAGATGLRYFEIRHASPAALEAALGRLRRLGQAVNAAPDGGGYLALDPAGNGILLSAV